MLFSFFAFILIIVNPCFNMIYSYQQLENFKFTVNEFLNLEEVDTNTLNLYAKTYMAIQEKLEAGTVT